VFDRNGGLTARAPFYARFRLDGWTVMRPAEQQRADIFTKALGRALFSALRAHLVRAPSS